MTLFPSTFRTRNTPRVSFIERLESKSLKNKGVALTSLNRDGFVKTGMHRATGAKPDAGIRLVPVPNLSGFETGKADAPHDHASCRATPALFMIDCPRASLICPLVEKGA